MAIANILGDGILKPGEITDEPFVDYVGTYTDDRNDKQHEYRFQAQNDAQAAKILKEQTDHWATVIEPNRSRSFYVDLKVRRA